MSSVADVATLAPGATEAVVAVIAETPRAIPSMQEHNDGGTRPPDRQ